MSDYDTDILLWSERQSELLRRRAAGELVNEAEVDWPNIAEEIESVGREQLHAVESLLLQALVHLLKADAWPDCRDVPAWRADAVLSGRTRRGATCRPCDNGSTWTVSIARPCARCRPRSTRRRHNRCRRPVPGPSMNC